MALTKIKTSNLETSIDLTGINDTATSQILTVSDTGIDVTGTVIADGLTVDGTSTLSATDSATNTVTTGLKVGHNTSGTTANGFGSALEFEAENSTYSNVNTYAKFESVVTDQIAIHSDLNVYTKYNNSLKKRMSFNDNGDINFYEDTGTTAKFFWDASAESLGIGATSAYRNGKLVVKAASVSQTSTTANLHISTTDSQAANLGGSIGLGGQIGGDETPFGYISGRKENSTSGNYAGYLAFATQDSTASVAERMRIDSSGNVHIGGTGQNTGSSFSFMNLGGDSYLNFNMDGRTSAVTSTSGCYIWSGQGSGGSYPAGTLVLQSRSNQNRDIAFITGSTPAEAMRIDSSGNVGIGVTNPGFTLDLGTGDLSTDGLTVAYNYAGHAVYLRNTHSIGKLVQISGTGGGLAGDISVTGTYSCAFNTSSDYRLKENVASISGATERLNQLNPIRFNFIGETERIVDGFLAHEVADIVPEAITGEKDAMRTEEYEVTPAVEATYDEDGNELTPAVEAVMGTREVEDYQGIDQSKLVPLLVGALQEQQTLIESLTTRLEALEGV